MKSVIKEKDAIYYVNSSDMVKFIKINSKIKHNDVCQLVRNHNICDDEYGPSFWEKKDLMNNPEEYNTEAVKWVSAFFEAHPWIEKMVIVFDN
jgi:hypothetical protein